MQQSTRSRSQHNMSYPTLQAHWGLMLLPSLANINVHNAMDYRSLSSCQYRSPIFLPCISRQEDNICPSINCSCVISKREFPLPAFKESFLLYIRLMKTLKKIRTNKLVVKTRKVEASLNTITTQRVGISTIIPLGEVVRIYV